MAKKSFKTHGRRAEVTFDIDDEEFKINPNVPGAVLLDFMGEFNEENPSAMKEMIYELFEKTLIAEDFERFMEFIRNPDNSVSIDVLVDICEYIVEELSGNDTLRPSSGPG